MTILHQFPHAFWSDGAAPAIIHAAQIWSYTELRNRLNVRTTLLRSQGVQPGQVVLAPDSPGLDLLLMQHALARLGAALLPYRMGLAESELSLLSGMTGAEWQWRTDLETVLATGCSTAKSTGSAASIALLIQTSGSRGIPKVAMLTADNLLASALAVNARLNLHPGDLWLTCLRLSHVGGISIGYRCALAGATLLLHDRFDARSVIADLYQRPVTHLSLVPPMLARILDLDSTPPPRLRVLLVGGQATSRLLIQRTLNAGWPLYLTYGMTETATQIATTECLIGKVPEPGLVGRLLPGLEIEVPNCESIPSALRIRGAMVMAGYANPNREPGHGLDNGWFESADLACLTKAGELKVLGRADRIRVIGGNNVSLDQVESVLTAAEGVTDAVVVALDDSIWGCRLIAVYCGEIAETALAHWCHARLCGSQRPRAFLRLAQIPLLDSGKYDRLQIESVARSAFVNGLETVPGQQLT